LNQRDPKQLSCGEREIEREGEGRGRRKREKEEGGRE